MPTSKVLYWIDSFCQHAFAGNPAAVCLCESEPDPQWMQNLARELNLSETAFVTQITEQDYVLRWFTPSREVNLCGHATLAAAFALWNEHQNWQQTLSFSTRSGKLNAQFVAGRIHLRFPLDPVKPTNPSAELIAEFGADLADAAISQLGLIVQLKNATAVKNWCANMDFINQLPFNALTLTALSEQADVDFVSRVFAPKLGIDEDPVTGAAHCALAPYWAQKLHKNKFIAHQVSHRQGQLEVEITEQGVTLGGQCQLILRGELHV